MLKPDLFVIWHALIIRNPLVIKTILILTAFSLTIFVIAFILMYLSKGVRFKGAHARGEQKSYDKAKRKLKLQKDLK